MNTAAPAVAPCGWPAYEARRAALRESLRGVRAADGRSGRAPQLALAKSTSNLFRDRPDRARQRLDMRAFDHVIAVDPGAGTADVEALTNYETLVATTLSRGCMPAVVPQLKTITIGGAAAGVGIEATSFRHGLVHDALEEIEVLLADGSTVVCTPCNEYSDLFFGFPNSYGTLGYALRAKTRLLATRPFVRVEHRRFGDAATYFEALDRACAPGTGADFVDGVVFDAGTLVLSEARFVDDAPAPSDYTFERIYYRSLLENEADHLSAAGYIWRWDTDWFWCSKNLGAQQPLLRRLYGRRRLNSRTYTAIMRWNSRWGVTRRLARLRGRHPESVIQDVDIPVARAAEFLAFLVREIGILPIWTCPLRAPDAARRFDLYPIDPATLYVNFGFWDVVASREPHEPGHFNRCVEREALRLGGIKSLYSDSFFTRDEFERAYGGERFAVLKAKYDPAGRLPGLYEKCVLRA